MYNNYIENFDEEHFIHDKELESVLIYIIEELTTTKFRLHDKPTSENIEFFKRTLTFLQSNVLTFTKKPLTYRYGMLLGEAVRLLMRHEVYKLLFIELNGFHFCLRWLSNCISKEYFRFSLDMDLRVLHFMTDLIDYPIFSILGRAIVKTLMQYLLYNKPKILHRYSKKENHLILNSICHILMRMAINNEEARNDIITFSGRSILKEYFSCDPTHPSTIIIFAALLALDDPILNPDVGIPPDVDLENFLANLAQKKVSMANDLATMKELSADGRKWNKDPVLGIYMNEEEEGSEKFTERYNFESIGRFSYGLSLLPIQIEELFTH